MGVPRFVHVTVQSPAQTARANTRHQPLLFSSGAQKNRLRQMVRDSILINLQPLSSILALVLALSYKARNLK